MCFPGQEVLFIRDPRKAPDRAILAVWGMRAIPEDVAARGVEVVRLEDGFLRSVGLGADLVRPLSWAVDWRGMYYDATHPSDLEILLSKTEFTDAMRARAATLRERIVDAGLTKYNVGAAAWRRPAGLKRVILTPGQVESDAALDYGAPGIRTNLGLLQAVRKANPDAYVVYKPHPDVVAGLRARGSAEETAGQWCDEIVEDASLDELFSQVDEVHVLTSLSGFEALLRGRRVTCYGQPFYAGWGLTADILPISRRMRRLTLDELVAGALVLYPYYLGRTSARQITPEEALNELLTWRERAGREAPWWRKLFRVILRRVVGVR